ncbi:anthranilate synthase component II [Williamwhitmania taraxaci]|uniref:Anthranilate synthase component 2 n=1 Tax=Williamwhitmania taraxaci TaxID=1640674 RepID=A0A1G6GNL2_9BACT|nr:aminodeoxychorismate/anthranilate synthase component II [Williamwhitmania taraxaci]SDB83345.1 anthranilate synthase component 2 [Williamwhitmania taraxaci]
MKIVIIDCFDSFTYNLHHYLEEIVDEVITLPYSHIDSNSIAEFDRIVFSPGPGHIYEYPKITELLDRFKTSKPILGVCLGHQIIGAYFGASLVNLETVVHGVSRPTIQTMPNDSLFHGLSNSFESARYHSWAIPYPLISDDLFATAVDNGLVMAIKHKVYNIRGVQFHPESILTPQGKTIISNWVKLC